MTTTRKMKRKTMQRQAPKASARKSVARQEAIGEKSYGSSVLASIREAASDLYEAGVMDKQTMRKIDASCLTPLKPLSAEQIKAVREREHVSQTVFARYLNVTTSLVGQWERGEKRPAGAALKLLALVSKSGLQAIA